ncbi:MAG: dTDP-4-dehydrorhamnose 3,5-epimerase [Planctomycetota bacterium]|nr:MAG: dTDP-4-dehydrorhamnose 3,5-epimerase [Planctomycetota bacterium]REK25811.1 MAG: dTDP-4-dehydrorhamnose 3,5-epimerase [Planctomycetota bacterium]REK49482.1 MAG: dTDP-4-dehydrorhamnose 3,5-epimerase [Planctomycetota bacterium]
MNFKRDSCLSEVSYEDGPIEGVEFHNPDVHIDARGWLMELYRHDELDPSDFPQMAYVSATKPGITRGPHAHRHQTDLFAFLGPGQFDLYLWDSRPTSSTFGRRMTVRVGADDLRIVIVPPGVVHGYKNVSAVDGWVFNFPNQLYAGRERREPVDEIRYEEIRDSPFIIDQ